MAKGIREKIKLVSSAGTGHFYTTTKNKRTKPEKLELKKKTQQQTQADTVEESLIHQGRHAAWREFFTHKSYPLSDLLSITGTDTSSLGSLALCEISFDWYDQQMETLPSTELIRSTLKNALEHFNRRRIIFFSAARNEVGFNEKLQILAVDLVVAVVQNDHLGNARKIFLLITAGRQKFLHQHRRLLALIRGAAVTVLFFAKSDRDIVQNRCCAQIFLLVGR